MVVASETTEKQKRKLSKKARILLGIGITLFSLLMLFMIAFLVIDHYTRHYLGVNLTTLLAVRRDINRNTPPNDFEKFTNDDLLEFESNLLHQLFLNPDTEIPYHLIFDALAFADISLNEFRDQPLIRSITDNIAVTNGELENLQRSPVAALVSNLITPYNINRSQLEAFCNDTSLYMDISNRHLAAFLENARVSFLEYNETSDREYEIFTIALEAVLENIELASVRFLFLKHDPVVSFTISLQAQKIFSELFEVNMPAFLSDWLLPENIYITANFNLGEAAGASLQFNDLNEARMDRVFRVLNGALDLANSTRYSPDGSALSIRRRNAIESFVNSDVHQSLSDFSSRVIAPIASGLDNYINFLSFEDNKISTDIFGTILSLSGVNYFEGELRPTAITASDVIFSLRFFVLREGEEILNPVSTCYEQAKDMISKNFYLSCLDSINFEQFLRSTSGHSFNASHFNITDGANSLAHDLRLPDELSIFIQDSELGNILSGRFYLDTLLSSDYISIVEFTSTPYDGCETFTIEQSTNKTAKSAEIFITVRLDLSILLSGDGIDFLSGVLIDALYLQMRIVTSYDYLIYEYALDEFGDRIIVRETGEAFGETEIEYKRIFSYQFEIYLNGLPREHIEVNRLLYLINFFLGVDANLDIDRIALSVSQNIYSLISDLTVGFGIENIDFLLIPYSNEVSHSGIFINSIFHILANTIENGDAKVLQSALQGMYAFNEYFPNERNFARDALITNPINTALVPPQPILTDSDFGSLLRNGTILAAYADNPFWDFDRGLELVQFISRSRIEGEALLKLTFRLRISLIEDFLELRHSGFNALMPSEIYFSIHIDWRGAILGGSEYLLREVDGRYFAVNNLSFEEQRQLFALTGFNENRILSAIYDILYSFRNQTTVSTTYLNGEVGVAF